MELINKFRTVKINYGNKTSRSCGVVNNLTDNHYCYFPLLSCVLETLKIFYKQWVFIYVNSLSCIVMKCD